MTGRNYAVSRRIVRNRVMPSHLFSSQPIFNLQLDESLYSIGVVHDVFPKWRTSSDRQVNSANPPLQVESPFYIRAIVELARAHRQSAAAFSHLLIASVDPIYVNNRKNKNSLFDRFCRLFDFVDYEYLSNNRQKWNFIPVVLFK